MHFLPAVAVGSSVYFVLFSAYLELSPKLTHIWYRINSDGERRVNLESYWHFLTRPFFLSEFWYPSNWDINYFVGAAFSSAAVAYFTSFHPSL